MQRTRYDTILLVITLTKEFRDVIPDAIQTSALIADVAETVCLVLNQYGITPLLLQSLDFARFPLLQPFRKLGQLLSFRLLDEKEKALGYVSSLYVCRYACTNEFEAVIDERCIDARGENHPA